MRPQWFLLVVAVLGGWGELSAQTNRLPTAVEQVRELPVDSETDPLRKLQIERFNATVRELKACEAMYQNGRETFTELCNVARRMTAARLDLASDRKERIAWLKTMVELTKRWERDAERRTSGGTESTAHLAYATYIRLDAEIQLYKAEHEK